MQEFEGERLSLILFNDKEEAPETEPWVWSREDRQAKVYRTVADEGPAWRQVVRRVTTDLQTGRTIQDVDAVWWSDKTRSELYCPIPDGPRDIRTAFYYLPPERLRGDAVLTAA